MTDELGLTRYALVITVFLLVVLLAGCSDVPSHFFSAPKEIEIDGTLHVACSGTIWTYSPSRDVADSSRKTYEITFTDSYGQPQDFKQVTSYKILNPENTTYAYAMPDPVPGVEMTKFADGTPFAQGGVVLFGEHGDKGRAIYMGPGNWKSVPCE